MSDARSLTVHGGGRPRGRVAWRGVARPAVARRSLPVIVESRLRAPVGGAGLVFRSDLVHRLLHAGAARAVLLTAGAGFGKTTLLAQWAERDERPFAWVALDGVDDDPAALVADVTQALDVAGASREDEPPPPLVRAARSRPWRSLVARARPFVLVLDDVHVLRAAPSLALVSTLLDHLPPGSQLAIAGRSEPALPLARWAVRGDLLRLGPEELAMTPAEASLLIGADYALPRRLLDALLRQTLGWPAGLRMAAIRLRERHAVAGFDGQDRLVADYLRDEVLAPLGPDATRFLTRTSMLDRLCGPLCDAVLEHSGSGVVLRDLARANLFVLPIDGSRGWYRCHPLLADALRAELQLEGPALEVELHRRASGWHEAYGDPREAIRHARAAGDLERAGDLVWAGLVPCLGSGDLAALGRWIADFDDRELAAQPALALAAAYCCLDRGDSAAAGRWAAAAEGLSTDRALPGGPPSLASAVAVLRALAATDGVARMAQDAALGRAGGAQAEPWRAICHLLEGVARRLGGDTGRARASLATAERLAVSSSAPSPLIRSLAQLAVIAARDGDWDAAAGLVARARAVGERQELRNDPSMIEVCAVSALVLARLGEPAEAARDARGCARLLATAAHVPPWLAVDARVQLASASLLVGDASASRALLREGRRALARMRDAGVLGGQLEETWRRAEAFPLAGVMATSPLSRAELRILRILPTHLSYREIGERLHVSQCTVKSQAHSVYRKLDVSSRSQAVERAGALGLIPAIDAPGATPLEDPTNDRQ